MFPVHNPVVVKIFASLSAFRRVYAQLLSSNLLQLPISVAEAASDHQRIALIDCQFALSTLYLHCFHSTSVHRHNQTTIFRNENELKSIQLELY
jgi:hypothetical protein